MSKITAFFLAYLNIKFGYPIPLDVYATLHDTGVDVTEYERTIRNGKNT